MARKRDKVSARLSKVGATFLRQKGSHASWRLPNGRCYTYSLGRNGPLFNKGALQAAFRELTRKLSLGPEGHHGQRG